MVRAMVTTRSGTYDVLRKPLPGPDSEFRTVQSIVADVLRGEGRHAEADALLAQGVEPDDVSFAY